MIDVNLFPNSEALVGVVLRKAMTCGVYSAIPKKDPVFPLITIHRAGGVPVHKKRLDNPTLQIDAWGSNKTNAYTTAATARQQIFLMEGQMYDDAFVTSVDDVMGLTWLPDPDTGRDRYLFSVRLILHAVPEESSSS